MSIEGRTELTDFQKTKFKELEDDAREFLKKHFDDNYMYTQPAEIMTLDNGTHDVIVYTDHKKEKHVVLGTFDTMPEAVECFNNHADNSMDARALSLFKTNFQQAVMWNNRAIANGDDSY